MKDGYRKEFLDVLFATKSFQKDKEYKDYKGLGSL